MSPAFIPAFKPSKVNYQVVTAAKRAWEWGLVGVDGLCGRTSETTNEEKKRARRRHRRKCA
jgi:hypothetical protein